MDFGPAPLVTMRVIHSASFLSFLEGGGSSVEMDFGLDALGSNYFYAAWAETSSLTTDIIAPVDTPELVCGKVCGTHPLNHTRYWFEIAIHVAWATVHRYWVHTQWRWDLADGGCAEAVRNVLIQVQKTAERWFLPPTTTLRHAL